MSEYVSRRHYRHSGRHAEGREADEITLIGATLTQLGDTLATIAAQKNFCGKQALGQKGD